MSHYTFRVALPAVMLVTLFFTLREAVQEERRRLKQEAGAQRASTQTDSEESIAFLLPFQYSRWVQDSVFFQWPAFVSAGLIAPGPQMAPEREMKTTSLTPASYVALPLAVGTYWFVIGAWMDRRFVQRRTPSASRLVRIPLKVLAALTIPVLLLFLGKDLLGGWPEGAQGAYGVTAWLALVLSVLMTELGYVRIPGGLGAHRSPHP